MSKLDDVFAKWDTECKVGPDGTIDNHYELVEVAKKDIQKLVDQIIGKANDYPSYYDSASITKAQRARAKELLG